MRYIYLLAFLLLAGVSTLQAQNTHKDSVTEIAKADTKNFMLNKTDLQRFRRLGPKRRLSDYFKPKAGSISDVRLLQDSDYVTAYRYLAFIKTRKRHSAGHYLLIFGSSVVAAVMIAVVVVLSTNGVGTHNY